MMTHTLPVFVVDDDASVLRSLSRLLLSADHRVMAFHSPQEFLDKAKIKSPGCVILDMQMPEFDGLEVQRQLAAKGSPLSVIFLTAHGQISDCVDALKSGAVDFLTKPVTDTVLLAAVNQALKKSEIRHREAAELSSIRERAKTLSPREYEVFCLVVTGLLNKQVAAELGTSEKTIKVHRARVTEKMKAGSLAELVVMAGKLGVIREEHS